MAKKDFSGALDNVMQHMAAQQKPKQQDPAEEPKAKKRGRPARDNSNEVQRATFIINKQLLQELKHIACAETGKHFQRVTLTETLEAAIRQYVDRYNRQNE